MREEGHSGYSYTTTPYLSEVLRQVLSDDVRLLFFLSVPLILKGNPTSQSNPSSSNTTHRPPQPYHPHQRSFFALLSVSPAPLFAFLPWLAMLSIDYASISPKGRFAEQILHPGSWVPTARRKRAAQKRRVGNK